MNLLPLPTIDELLSRSSAVIFALKCRNLTVSAMALESLKAKWLEGRITNAAFAADIENAAALLARTAKEER